ncbi:MAG: hypothetical protein WC637_06935 [Victivallales bacterium]|jgi:hypothetical protein
MEKVRVSKDRWNFELEGSGRFITPIGGNMLNDQHPGQGTLFQKFDAGECKRRLGIMAELGLNCLRQAIGVNQVFDSKTGLKSQGMKNWDTFIGLAEKYGIHLMPVGGYLGGIFTREGKRKELAKVYEELVAKLQRKRQIRKRSTVTLTFSLLGLYTCSSYQDRIWDEVHKAIRDGQTPDFKFIA